MQASAVEKIEVITNPSAKYTPEGTSGIINIDSLEFGYMLQTDLLNFVPGVF